MSLSLLKLVMLVFSAGFTGCISSDDDMPGYIEGFPEVVTPMPPGYSSDRNPYSLGLVGNQEDVETDSESGLVIMGGSTDVDQALEWMIERSGAGDFVVIRASGTDAYNDYIFGLGQVNSVETLLIDSRAAANDEKVVETLRNAEAVFIAGGDQSNYMNYWKDTPTQEALNYLMHEKGVPVGGTSAGAAIMGGLYYSGENGSITGDGALSNPYNSRVTLYENDFLNAPFLSHTITDQHFSQRDRQGRLVAFLGRFMRDEGLVPWGIGVDERTAVCIDSQGVATVFGANDAYFLQTSASKPPERMEADQNLQWNQNQQAVRVYRINGSNTGNGVFPVDSFDLEEASGGTSSWWWVENGQLHSKAD